MQLHFLVLSLCALYGFVFTLGKLTVDYASPLFITGGRMTIAGLVLLVFQLIINRKDFIFKKQYLIPCFIIALFTVYLSNVLEFWALQYMEAGKACFLYSFCPIATALMSYAWFSEKITLQKWFGLLIGILGFIPVLVMHAAGIEDTSGTFFVLSYAEIAMIGAAIASALGWIAMRVLVKNQQCSSLMANSSSMLIGGVISLIHSAFVDEWNPLPVTEFEPFLQWFLLLTLVSNIICYNLNAILLRVYTATYLSFAGLSQPFFAALFGWLFLNEVPSQYFWISVVFVSFGLYLYYQEELRQGHIHHQSSLLLNK